MSFLNTATVKYLVLLPYYRNRGLIKIFSVLIENSRIFSALVVDKMVHRSEERLVVTLVCLLASSRNPLVDTNRQLPPQSSC